MSRRKRGWRAGYDEDEWRKLHLTSPDDDDDPAIDHAYKAYLRRLQERTRRTREDSSDS